MLAKSLSRYNLCCNWRPSSAVQRKPGRFPLASTYEDNGLCFIVKDRTVKRQLSLPRERGSEILQASRF